MTINSELLFFNEALELLILEYRQKRGMSNEQLACDLYNEAVRYDRTIRKGHYYD